jgi:hypothetical protein
MDGRFAAEDAEDRAIEDRIRQRLAGNVGVLAVTFDAEGIAAVLLVLRRQVAAWRFDVQRRDVEPEPAQWDARLRAIVVPAAPTFEQVAGIKRQVRALPRRVLAVLDAALLRLYDIGTAALLDRFGKAPTAHDAKCLRSGLVVVRSELAKVKGKRGPRADVGPSFRAVVAALKVHAVVRAGKRFTADAVRELAAELLRDVGMPAPEGRSRLIALSAEPAGEIIGHGARRVP